MHGVAHFIILFFLILVIYTTRHLFHIYEGFDGEMYRLGDMINIESGPSNRYDKKKGFEFHLKNYPDSIATEYMLKTKKSNDFDTLLSIVNNRKSQKFQNDTLVVHLRIGDVIDDSNKSVNELLSDYVLFNNGHSYVKPKKYYTNILDSIKNYSIKNVLFIGGFHKKGNHEKSMKYVDSIKSYFEENGFKCATRINQNADDDFIIMANSKYFVPSGGGFSRVIKQIVKMKGGTVIE